LRDADLDRFKQLIRAGAGGQDIFDADKAVGFASNSGRVNEAFVQTEIDRMAMHQRSLCPILETHVGRCESILDVGCSSGATTVALSLSSSLQPEKVIGIDPNLLSLQAAEVRARAYDLSSERVVFRQVIPGDKLPFEDGSFALVTCVSVLEFISRVEQRKLLIDEMKRVTRVGGHVFLSTTNALRLREYHSRRFFGNQRRREGYPWANSPWQLRKFFADFDLVDLSAYESNRMFEKLGAKSRTLPRSISKVMLYAYPWQKVLARKVRLPAAARLT